ncbi:hypothetical protein BH09SUM1_BH09SUM1_31430 [soil metagenome]
MSICIIGVGPYPTEAGAVVTAPAIRLRLFTEPFINKKYEVSVALLEDTARAKVPIAGAARAMAFSPDEILNPALVKERLGLDHIRAVFGVGSLMPCTAAARLAQELDCACWIDLNGDPLTELHAAQLRQGGNPDVVARDHIWKLLREALLRGDAFSTVSGPQRYALLGQLGLLGRYGNDWLVSKRLFEIPNGVPKAWSTDNSTPAFPEILKESGMREGARYVFFGGSWNVWMDDATMGKALTAALDADPDLYFVACGIPTGPAGEQVRSSIMKAVSAHRERGHVVELPPQHLDAENALLAHAGTCLSLDRSIPESELGARNRLLPMVRWGARPVISVEAEVETLLVAEGLASGIHQGNWDRAAKEILLACGRSKDERKDDRARGREWLETVVFDRVAEPALQWVANGTARWPACPCDGLLDRWAALPADPEKLFPEKKKKNWLFG